MDLENWATLYKKQMGDVLHHIFLDFFLDYQRYCFNTMVLQPERIS